MSFKPGEYFDDDEPVDGPRSVVNKPIPPHPRDLDHDDEAQFLGVQTKCRLCGKVYTPWPDKAVCPSCGARPKA